MGPNRRQNTKEVIRRSSSESHEEALLAVVALNVLSESDCQALHEAALRVLERVGVVVTSDEVCRIFSKAGAHVDPDGTVRVPAQLVNEALAETPKEIYLACTDGHRFRLPGTSTHYASRVKYPKQEEYPPSGVHVPTRQDIVNNCRLANALPLVEAVFVLDGPTADFDDDLNWLLTPATVLTSTTKHIISPSIHLSSARFWAEAAEAASASGDLRRDPLLTIEVSPHGPLRLDADTADVELFAARKHIPLLVLPIPMAGVTSPLTLAGTLLVGVAESLFMITLAQLVNPGTPILYGGNALTFNMLTTAVSLGDPEAALLAGGELAMARFYGLPNYRVTGFTDSHFPDVQSGIEKTLSTFVSLASGAHLATLGGALGTSTVISYEQIVIDHDIFEVVQRVVRGIEVNQDTLAEEVIESIGHRGGEYLMHAHTVRWLRSKERYFGGSFNRKPEMSDSETMLANAHRRVEEILSRPAEGEVPADVIERVRSYVRSQGTSLLT
ncbi:MAG: trimethylamine methyltransferase family protein [Chloroflexota bacterium]